MPGDRHQGGGAAGRGHGQRGHYAFAHLTLQEHLAATQIALRGTDRLTGTVDDPWWRETTLLWAAGADATPVIDACLSCGTVRALALAFDCADEARTLAPATRRALDDVLTGQPGDDAHHRLITGVKAARDLREVIWLNESTTVCARPVTRDLYAMFAHDERTAGRHTPDPQNGGEADAPAVGMWAGDAVRFVTWLNGLFDDGTTYRLPTAEELTDPAISLVTGLDHHTIWAQGQLLPRLHRPGTVPWPYTPDPDRLRHYPATDRERNTAYLRLALSPHDSDQVKAYRRIFTHALTIVREADVEPLRHVVVAFGFLLASWPPPRGRTGRLKPGEALTDLDAFLTAALSQAPSQAPTNPNQETPEALLRRSRDLFNNQPPTSAHHDLRERARPLADHAHGLIAAILDRSAPDDGAILSRARIELLAAVVLLRRAQDHDAAALLAGEIRALIALRERAEGHISPNEVLLLIRN